MIKEAVALLLTVSLLAAPQGEAAETSVRMPVVEAKGCVVMEYESGRVLFSQSGDERLPMASTTKIMTAMLTLEQLDRDSYFVVDSEAIQVEGSSMGLQEGDQATLNNLAYGMLLPSGNDAAGAAAVRIAGSIPAFVEQMNQRAEELGLTNTHYVTPSGLDAEEHYTSARDLAALTREALQNPDFREICSQYKAVQEYGNPPYRRWLTNHNKLLQRYDGCIGVKTGFTDNAHRCLVTAAERDGVTLIVVTLNCPDDFTTHQQLYDYFFSRLEKVPLSGEIGALTLPVAGTNLPVTVAPVVPLEAALLPGEQQRVECQVELPAFLYAPVQAGQLVGEVTFRCDGVELLQVPLVAQESVAAPNRRTVLQKLKDLLSGRHP